MTYEKKLKLRTSFSSTSDPLLRYFQRFVYFFFLSLFLLTFVEQVKKKTFVFHLLSEIIQFNKTIFSAIFSTSQGSFQPEAGLLNKSSCLAPALGFTKLFIVTTIVVVTLVVLLKSDLDVQRTHILR